MSWNLISSREFALRFWNFVVFRRIMQNSAWEKGRTGGRNLESEKREARKAKTPLAPPSFRQRNHHRGGGKRTSRKQEKVSVLVVSVAITERFISSFVKPFAARNSNSRLKMTGPKSGELFSCTFSVLGGKFASIFFFPGF